MGGKFREFHGSVAVRENIIHEYCVAYNVWLIRKSVQFFEILPAK